MKCIEFAHGSVSKDIQSVAFVRGYSME